MSLWTSDAAAAATGGTTGAWEATGVSIDTRTLEPGDLFVALQAARDGHDFVAQALEKGAAAALVSRIPDGVDADRCLLVEDVQAGLEALGRAARARTSARVVTVTGSVGKTSTKEMLRDALAPQGATHASVASYNNHWGVPLTLARMPAETEFAIIEIGMNHRGEIAPLAVMARPHVAMVTTVGPAHLEAFGTIEGIAREKASICEGLEPGGIAVMNADLPQSPILYAAAEAAGATLVRFGTSDDADYTLGDVKILEAATVGRAVAQGEEVLLKVASPGAHFALNGLGALAACVALGADLARSLFGLGQWSPPAGRGARQTIVLDAVHTEMTLELFDDAYNANPASMAAALAVLAAQETVHDIGRASKGRRIAFLGDMKELGPTEAEAHANLATLDAMAQLDVVHCVGPLMANLYDQLPLAKRGQVVASVDDILPKLKGLLDAGDVVLAKGSLSMGLGRIVQAIKDMGVDHAPDKNGG